MSGRRVAFFARTLENDYQAMLREDCAATARRRGFSVRDYNAGNDADRQVRQIQECLREPDARRPTAILVSPVREIVLRSVAREAARLGMAWVSLNRTCDYLSELRREYPRQALFSVDADQRQVGRFQGRQFKILLPKGGEVFYIQGPLTTSSAQLRLAGVQQELAGTEINLVPFSADWSAEAAAQGTRNWIAILRGRKLPECVVGAQNDTMASGARMALQEEASSQRRPEIATIRVTGCDGSVKFGQQLVMEGRLTATVTIPSVAGRAVEEVASVFDGGRPPMSDLLLEVDSYPSLDDLIRTTRKARQP